MAITTVNNPVTGEDVTLATGVVEKILIKDKVDAYGNTHTAGLKVGDEWINISLKTQEGRAPQVRFAKGKPGQQTWHTLNEGDEVRIQVKPNEYNGKTYYSTTSSRITVLKEGNGKPAASAPAQRTPNAAPSAKRDDSGIEAGNALTVALLWSKNKLNEDIVPLACDILEEGRKLKAVYKKLNPSHTDYEIGAACGQAMIIWATVNPGADLDGAVNWCAAFLRDTKEVIQTFAKTGVRPDVVEEEEVKVSPPKPVARKPAAKKPEPVEEDDFDDSIPF